MARPAGQRLSGDGGGRRPGLCRRDRRQKDRGCARVVTGDWVRSTPAWDGETLYVGDMAEVVVALDGATGSELWRVDFPRRYETPVPDFGFASSPLVVGDFLYVQAANSLVKLDKRTGQAVWRSLVIEEGMASNGAFSSPVLAVLAGREQLVALNRESLYGLDPENGQVL